MGYLSLCYVLYCYHIHTYNPGLEISDINQFHRFHGIRHDENGSKVIYPAPRSVLLFALLRFLFLFSRALLIFVFLALLFLLFFLFLFRFLFPLMLLLCLERSVSAGLRLLLFRRSGGRVVLHIQHFVLASFLFLLSPLARWFLVVIVVVTL